MTSTRYEQRSRPRGGRLRCSGAMDDFAAAVCRPCSTEGRQRPRLLTVPTPHGILHALHPPTDRHLAIDGGGAAAWHPRLPAIAGVGVARDRGTQPGGEYPVSGCQRRDDGLAGHHAAGASARADLRSVDDDFRFVGGPVDHRAAVQHGPRHRHRRAGCAGGDQSGEGDVAEHAALSAGVQPGESGRRADHDARAHLGQSATA